MNEQNPVSTETTIAELQARINELTSINEVASQGMQSWYDRFNRMQSKVQDWFDNSVLEEGDIVSDWLIDQFDIETTEEIDVVVVATYSGTITVPKGTDISDIEVITDLPWSLSFEGNLDSNVSYDDIDISLN